MRILFTFCLTLLFLSSQVNASALGTGPSKGSSPALGGIAIPLVISPVGPDIKPLQIPFRIPTFESPRIPPNLNEFFNQLDKYHELKVKAYLIEDWVYLEAMEMFVADYEEAAGYLDVSDSCLDEAMIRLLTGPNNTLAADPAIDLAKSELNKAEHILELLIEVAKIDLEAKLPKEPRPLLELLNFPM